jgi:hypothetical protein
MSDYFALPSVKSIYFKSNHQLYQMKGSQPFFQDPIHLKDVDKLWIKRLNIEDRKKLEKDLKKFKKI